MTTDARKLGIADFAEGDRITFVRQGCRVPMGGTVLHVGAVRLSVAVTTMNSYPCVDRRRYVLPEHVRSIDMRRPSPGSRAGAADGT